MSDKAKDTTKEKKTDTAASGDKKGKTVKAVAEKKETKIVWTLERAKRFARRFPNEQVWAATHQASYKSATAHGWVSACVAEMGKTAKIIPGNFKKPTPTDSTPSGKKAA